MVVNQLVFRHRVLRKHKLSYFPIRYYIVIDVLSLMRQNWLLYSRCRSTLIYTNDSLASGVGSL